MPKQDLPLLNLADMRPFNFQMPLADASLVEVMFGPGAKVVHPCTVFARSAGFASWKQAVETARSGKIVQGQAPRLGKTTLDVDLFNNEVTSAGLLAEYSELGLVAVGLPSRFK